MASDVRRTLSYVLAARARLELDIDTVRVALHETSTYVVDTAFEMLKRRPDDRSVSAREFESFLVSAAQFPRPIDVFRLFRRYDLQRSGSVDLVAFRYALRPLLLHNHSKTNAMPGLKESAANRICCRRLEPRQSARKLLAELFAAEIEVEAEWNSCLCRLVANPQARACFHEIDADDDGTISADDLDQFMRRQCRVAFDVEAAHVLLRSADRDQDGVIGLLDWVSSTSQHSDPVYFRRNDSGFLRAVLQMDLLTPVELSQRNASFETNPFGFNTFVAVLSDPPTSAPFVSHGQTNFPGTMHDSCPVARRMQPHSANVLNAYAFPDYKSVPSECKPSTPSFASSAKIRYDHDTSASLYCSQPFSNTNKASSAISLSSSVSSAVARSPTERGTDPDKRQLASASAQVLERRRDSIAEGSGAGSSTNTAAPDVGIAGIRSAIDNEVALLNVFRVQIRLQSHSDKVKQRLATEAGVDAFSAFFALVAIGRRNHNEQIGGEQLMQFLKRFGISCSLEESQLWIRRHSVGPDDALDLQRFRDAVAPARYVVPSIVDVDDDSAATVSEEQERAIADTLSHLVGVEIAHERVKMAFSERADVDYLRLFGRIDTHDCGRVTCNELRIYFHSFGGERRNDADAELLLRRYCRASSSSTTSPSFGFADFIRALAPN